MKRDRLNLGGGMSVETGPDWNGRYFICHAKGASIFTRSHQDVRRFLRVPIKTESREALDSWLSSLEGTDAAAEKKVI